MDKCKVNFGFGYGMFDMFNFCFFVQAIRTGWVHPNINLENPDDGVVCGFIIQLWFDVMFAIFYFVHWP